MSGLLAKRPRGPLSVGLAEHSLQTEEAALALFDPSERLLSAWLRFFRLPPALAPDFLLHLQVAALFHDLGKANRDFQAAVAGGGGPQALRHEHLSGLLLFLPEVSAWLRPALDLPLVAAAVLSHHCKVSAQAEHRWCQPRTAALALPLLLGHPELHAVLQRVAALAGLGPPPALPSGPWHPGGPWAEAWEAGMAAHDDFPAEGPRHQLSLALKAGLIAADAASSGLVREGHSIQGWIRRHLHLPALGPGELEEAILAPRRASIERRTGQPFTYQQFQEQIGALGPRGLLLAACGAGKTLAAWRWAEATLAERPAGRIIFLYPTRGTATEGFRDYVGWAPEGEAALVHGTADFELAAMMENPPESLRGKELEPDEASARLYALGLWGTRYFSATLDQLLSFLEHHYSGLCLLPVLVDSLLIIDEVHALDEGLFRKLLAFVERFDLPLLAMTATLSPRRQRDLTDRGLRAYPAPEARAEMDDLLHQEERPRYLIEALASPAQAEALALAAWRRGERVLWVFNTVRRCQEAAQALRRQGLQPLVYHSRYTLRDRQRQHAETIAAFQQRESPAIALTTQVCEMSLDLDADLLLTELAPPSALIQRCGRVNRSRSRPAADRGRIGWYAPPGPLPYSPEELRAGEAMMRLLGAECSQGQMAEALARCSPLAPRGEGVCGFVESGLFALRRGFREDDGHSAQALLASTLPQALERLRRRASFPELILPAPRRLVQPAEGLPPWVGLVPDELYDPCLGLLDPGATP